MHCFDVLDSLRFTSGRRMIKFVVEPHFIRLRPYLGKIIHHVCFKQKFRVRRSAVKLN